MTTVQLAKGNKKGDSSQNKDKPNRMSESNQALNDNENSKSSEESLEPAEKKYSQELIINDAKTVLQEAFEAID